MALIRNYNDHGKVLLKIRLLEYKSIDIEARGRRNNLIFYGLAEFRNEDCSAVICQFINDNFDIDVNAAGIARVHRLGRFTGRGQRRPIIVAFKDYNLTENIISLGLNLKDTGFSVTRDYPPEITRARKTLWPEYKRYKQENPRSKISIVYPAKLIVTGRVVTDLFPEWDSILSGSRIDLNHPSQESYKSKLAPFGTYQQSTPRVGELPSSACAVSGINVQPGETNHSLNAVTRVNVQPGDASQTSNAATGVNVQPGGTTRYI